MIKTKAVCRYSILTAVYILALSIRSRRTHFDGDDPVDLLGDDPGEARFEGLESGDETPVADIVLADDGAIAIGHVDDRHRQRSRKKPPRVPQLAEDARPRRLKRAVGDRGYGGIVREEEGLGWR